MLYGGIIMNKRGNSIMASPANDVFALFDKIFDFDNDDWFSLVNFDIQRPLAIPANVYLKENKNYVLEAALAGYNEEDVDISFHGDYLLLVVKKEEKKESEKRNYLCRGLKQSKFSERLYVPSDKYNQEQAKATFKNGVLKVEVPAKPEQEARKVKISTD
jgi:HSP20 family molecular chaperone IbpA